MIQIVHDKKHYRVIVEGHAQYADPGHDIICAAVSALVHTLAETVERMTERGVSEDCAILVEQGHADILCVPDPGCVDTVKTVMDTVCVGFEGLGQAWPEYVSYKIRK